MFVFCKKCKKEISDGSVFCSWCGKKQISERVKTATHRRSRGTGTIRIDRRKKSPYIVYAPRSANSSYQQYLAAFKTKKEAQEFLDSYNQNAFPDLYNATLSKIYELWSKVHFPTLESQNGITGYEAAYKDLSSLHNCKMREIKTIDFQQCIDKVAEKFSRSKCEKVKQLCSQLCKYSIQNDIIDKNYADFIVLPKEEKKDKVIFTKEELQLLWNHADDKRVQLILFMVYTGFRIGEVATILKKNVFIDGGYIIGGIKTEAGKNRVVPFPPSIPEIKEFVREWLKDKTNTTQYLFGVQKNSIREYWFYPALADLGLIDPPIYDAKTRKKRFINPRITPHCTRHTFASLSAKSGVSPENLQKIVGHADFSTTANIYIHQDIDALKQDMSKIQKY